MAKEFAVIATGGKQYKVSAGETVGIERLPVQESAEVVFDKVLLRTAGDAVEVGAPYILKAQVKATVTRNARDRKEIVFRYHSKTRYRKKKGHRQQFTEVKIVSL